MLQDEITALAETVGQALKERGLHIGTAESCTGGLLAGALTAIPGSSEYVKGGVVAYSNEIKENLLGVRSATLAEHGAVSGQTAEEMAQGAQQRLDADVGVGITGVAGPGGGSEDKPVGLVYIGVATPNEVRVRRDIWPGSRGQIREASVKAALEFVMELLKRP